MGWQDIKDSFVEQIMEGMILTISIIFLIVCAIAWVYNHGVEDEAARFNNKAYREALDIERQAKDDAKKRDKDLAGRRAAASDYVRNYLEQQKGIHNKDK